MTSVFAKDPNATKDEGYKWLLSLTGAVEELSGDKLANHFTEDMTFNFGSLPTIETRAATAKVFRWLFRGCTALSHDIEEVHNLPDRIIGITVAKYTLKNGFTANVRACSVTYKRPNADNPSEKEMYQFDYFGDFTSIFQQLTSILGTYNPEENYD